MVTDTVPSSGKGLRYRAFGRCGMTAMVVEVCWELVGLM